MLGFIDRILDGVTMYRLVLYVLMVLIVTSVIFSAFGILPYHPFSIVISMFLLIGVCFFANSVFSFVFKAPTNLESVYITAFILTCLILPLQQVQFDRIAFYVGVGVLAMASKYILAIRKKHIFNPAAIAVLLTSYLVGQGANWWVGTISLLPIIFVGGLLIVRKLQKEAMVGTFVTVSLVTMSCFAFLRGDNVPTMLSSVLLYSSFFFFTFIMFIEPLTSPHTKKFQILYAVLVGVLISPEIHVGNIYSTPELALVLGNIFSYIVSPKYRLVTKLKEKIAVGPDIIDFLFAPDRKITFTPGQYMEWTLPHKNADQRGNRRYFTIASSPTEDVLHLGVKFYEQGSSFKKALRVMQKDQTIVAGQLSGDFILPKNQNGKYVFIAGGIGVTPYRSMIKYLIDTKEKRDIVMMYADRTVNELVYTDVFDTAEKELGIRIIYTLTDTQSVPKNWKGKVGRIDAQMIKEEIADFSQRYFYLSGPHTMVTAYEETLTSMGVPKTQIKKDFFPGYV